MPEVPGVWTETFRVRTYETDPQARVSIQTLCNYFQEAAGSHALDYGVSIHQLLEKNLTWVMLRLRIEIDAYPALGQTVRVETWPTRIEGIYAHRDFLYYLLGDDGAAPRLVGRGASLWLVVDVNRKRPVRIPPLIDNMVIAERPRALDGGFDRLQPPTEAEHQRRFRVRYGDLDLNGHVNNAGYAGWAVESVPEAVLHAAHLGAVELHFRAETTLGDTVVVQTQQAGHDAAPTFLHRLACEADDREVALARTRWVDEQPD